MGFRARGFSPSAFPGFCRKRGDSRAAVGGVAHILVPSSWAASVLPRSLPITRPRMLRENASPKRIREQFPGLLTRLALLSLVLRAFFWAAVAVFYLYVSFRASWHARVFFRREGEEEEVDF